VIRRRTRVGPITNGKLGISVWTDSPGFVRIRKTLMGRIVDIRPWHDG
jgi:hypothetical protein